MHKIFGKKSKSKDNLADYTQNSTQNDLPRPAAETNSVPETNGTSKQQPPVVQKNDTPPQPPRPKLVFHCQQAHGSPTGIISGFTNVKELYQKIADCYDMPVSEILFCTLNTHKVDMSRLLGGQIGLEDFIFAHVRGQPKECEVTKSEDALGLTITDNGAGYAFIKRIKENSIMDKCPLVSLGDHIEKIDGKSLVGCRHFEVAKMLKEIQKGTTFTIRVVEPMKSGFSFVEQKQSKKGSSNIGSGKQTLRLRSTGPATVEDVDDSSNLAIDKINGLLESFMGINDTELAQQIWDMGNKLDNPSDFAMAIDKSEIKDFGFADDFVFDLWGAISDAKSGRLNKTDVKDFSEQF
ncbi:PDZ domain-containing protein GIPC1-like isoform X2 [Mytilus galloprovincialis]|uniref:PDZ domain-containing protein GIPC n=1 Tax=Mytilus galloprovincialis TaxID=29158 RepID=A0A8B6EDJ9_MYTGA|nr:PDZ domain-containing protein GIPC [Mytilus galloprovincialis]